MSVTEILEAVRALSDEERAQVKALLDTLPSASKPQMTEDEFEQYLAAKGIVTLPEPMSEDGWREEQEWEPIEVEGTPLSQMVIKDRG